MPELCIHDVEHAYSADGGLAILYGNLAVRGSVVKTAGVDESILTFSGPAVVVESQEDAVDAILHERVKEGDVVSFATGAIRDVNAVERAVAAAARSSAPVS